VVEIEAETMAQARSGRNVVLVAVMTPLPRRPHDDPTTAERAAVKAALAVAAKEWSAIE
jgi:hypothetical protein